MLGRFALKRIAMISAIAFSSLLLALVMLSMPSQAYASDMYRMYNPNSGEHFYTSDSNERNSLYIQGWDYEGIGWVAPDEGDDVYRVYNPSAGDHHYTTNAAERDMLVGSGWNFEGVGWKTGGDVPLYRQYNKNARVGTHNFTTNKAENDMLVRGGWKEEGIAWYGIALGRADSMPSNVVRPTPSRPGSSAGSSAPSNPGIPDTVYVTPTGKKYHRASCASTKNSRLTALPLSTAQSRGYTPCKLCF